MFSGSYTAFVYDGLSLLLVPSVILLVSYVTYGVCIRVTTFFIPGFTVQSLSLNALLGVLLIYSLPVFLFLFTVCGMGLYVGNLTPLLTSSNLRCLFVLGTLLFVSFYLLRLRQSTYINTKGALTLFYACMFTALAWIFLNFTSNLLSFILALELITVAILFVFWEVNASFGSNFQLNLASASRRFKFFQGQYAFVSIVLSLIWLMGIATILFLWAVGYTYVTYNSVDFFFVGLVNANWAYRSFGVSAHVYVFGGNCLGFAVLLKLLLQPILVFLVIFYKAMPPVVLFSYFQFYYVFVLFYFFFYIITPFGFAVLSWHWLVVIYVLALVIPISFGTEVVRDFGTVLAYSTFVNLSFFLITAGYHSI